MTIIPQNNRYLPHELKTKYYAVKLYRTGASVHFVCRRYKISKSSLMRWNKKYDDTKESLINKSHKPISKHPMMIHQLILGKTRKWMLNMFLKPAMLVLMNKSSINIL